MRLLALSRLGVFVGLVGAPAWSAAAGPAPVLEYRIEASFAPDGADVEGRVDVRFHLHPAKWRVRV